MKRHSVNVGEWYAVDYEVFERTLREDCPDGDHPRCVDDPVCEVDDGQGVAMAERIASLHNEAQVTS